MIYPIKIVKKSFFCSILCCFLLFLSASKSFLVAQDLSQEAVNDTVVIRTSFGDMKAVLYNETPLHRDNFVKLVKEGFYDNTLFHRVIEQFMIQGGDPDSKSAVKDQALGEGDVGYTIPAEFRPHLFHKKGALAAARQPDAINPEKASSGCQFYIVQGRKHTAKSLRQLEARMNASRVPNKRPKRIYTEAHISAYDSIGGTPHLDQGYTVFGQIVEGLDVLDKIAAVPTDARDRPVEDIPMQIFLKND